MHSEVSVNIPREKQHENNRGRDPERAVQVGVAIKHVQEVRARVQRGAAAAQDFVGVDVEELRVEAEGPEEALGGERAGRLLGGGGRVVEGQCTLEGFVPRRAVAEVGVDEFEVVLQIGVP